MKALLTSLALTALTACYEDETISGYSDPDTTWILTELDGVPFNARATITFPEKGRIAGKGPCNSYFASQEAPYPWFEVSNVGSTRKFCPEMQAENAFLMALRRVTLAEVLGNTLILSDEAGFRMVFTTGL